ncbi:MAG TPA: ATP-binding protein, partial [Nitrospirota bacterium]|nr:ATP-binding protein [Nitrospirota bacterium]
AQLVEAEKHASVGILAAGVAHEINNPLTAVLTFSNLLLEQMPKEDPRYERMRMVARETERARHIVRQLMGLAKETPLALAKKNVNQPIRDIVESLLAQGELDDVDFHLNLSPDLPLVMADCGQIGQVVLNLILNALHSITPPGAIEVLTRTDGRYVDIEVSDTGCGIPAEHLGRVFDSFFTTKSKGTGLGLAVSYRIVKRHGGDIEVRSEEGKGSTFTVRLPLNG